MDLKKIMTSPFETTAPETSLQEAGKKMLDLGIGLLPVSKGQKVVGIVSDRDITSRCAALWSWTPGMPPLASFRWAILRCIFAASNPVMS